MTSLTSLPPLNLSDLDISGQNFGDDIGWKLSADDVLKAFPSDEQIFVGSQNPSSDGLKANYVLENLICKRNLARSIYKDESAIRTRILETAF